MSHTGKVLKNSFWLVAQPLILNIISIFVIGYIARSLGKDDYGKFTFAFAFISLFMPIINMGLGSLATREIAENREIANEVFSRILMLRVVLAFIALIVIVLTINILDYHPETRLIVYIAGSTLFFYSITITINSAFQGFETMEYIGYSNFISGFVLTLLSVVILLMGYRLIGLTLVYAFGSLLGMVISMHYMVKIIPVMKCKIDVDYWKKSLIRGFPFFIPGFVYTISMKIGIILLSKESGDAAVGVFGAANSLVEKLTTIPDGVGTALYPTMAILFQQSYNDARKLIKRFNIYMFMIGLPLAIGTTILAKQIIIFIYGVSYQAATVVLQILIWWLFFQLFISIQGWSLFAAHQEKKTATISIISSVACIILNLLLIPYFGAWGAAIAILLSAILSFALVNILVFRYIMKGLYRDKGYLKIIVANVLMALILIFSRNLNVFISIIIGSCVYGIMIVCLKILRTDEVRQLYNNYIRKRGFES